MEQVLHFFTNLFGTESWPPRWHCGEWTDFHGWLYIISDLTIWASYFAIPVILLTFLTKKKDIPLPTVFLLFISFILLCGFTHLIDASMFWWPAYRLNALVRFFTAVISVTTVLMLFKVLPEAMALKTSKEFNAELEKRVEVEMMLQENAKELEQKSKEIESFVYISSHDLQEPVKSILALSNLLKQEYSDKLDDDGKKALNYISDGATRMQNLIHGLLEYNRVGINAVNKMVNINHVLSSVLDDLSALIKASDAKIEYKELPVVNGNEVELRLLFQNLIANSLKFKKVDVAPKIEINSSENPEHWQFSVRDNGIGIDPVYFEKIFNIFQRLHNNKEYEGNGIGLAHCKKIIDHHQGRIWVESELNTGSTFYFTINKVISDEKV